MVNILIIEGGTGYGGSSSYLYGFLKYLDRNKFIPSVAFYNYAEGPNIVKINKLGIKTIFLSKTKLEKIPTNSWQGNFPKFLKVIIYFYKFLRSNLPLAFKIVKLIKQNKIQLILLNAEVHYHIPGVIAAKLTNTPCFVRKSGVGNDTSKQIRGFLSRFVDVFISSCPAETSFHKENKWHSKKIVTIYEGVDMKEYTPLPKEHKIHKEIGISCDSLLVGYISRLDVGKGHDDFIRSARIVIKEIPNAYFIIVGDDMDSKENIMRNDLKKLAKELAIEDNIIFTGWRNDVKEILKDIDIFVHCPKSWKEGMGVATLEAVASGKPVIITENWGLAETAKDGFNGFVVNIGDYEMIGKRITELLLNRNLLKKMGDNSRLYAEENFDIAKNVKKFEELFVEALNNKKQ